MGLNFFGGSLRVITHRAIADCWTDELAQAGVSASYDETLVGLVADGDGNAYVTNSDTDCILKIGRGGEHSIFAGSPLTRHGPPPCGADRPMSLEGLAVAPDGTIFLADANNHRIYRLDREGQGASVFVGSRRGWIDGQGEAARLRAPSRLAPDGRGGLFLVAGWQWLRHIDPQGNVTSLGPLELQPADRESRSFEVSGLAVGPDGELALTAEDDGLLVKVRDGCVVGRLIGEKPYRRRRDVSPPTTPGLLAWAPTSATYDGDGNVLVVDTFTTGLRRVTPGGEVSEVVGPDGRPLRVPDAAAVLCGPDGSIYISSPARRVILAIAPDGRVRTFATGLRRPGELAMDAEGRLLVIDNGQRLVRIGADGSSETLFVAPAPVLVDGSAEKARFLGPGKLARSGDGSLYVAEPEVFRIRKVSAAGEVSTPVRGEGAWPGEIPNGADIADIAVSADGRLYAIDDAGGGIYLFEQGAARKVATYEALASERPFDAYLGLEVLDGRGFAVADGFLHRVYLVGEGGPTERLAGGIRGTWDGDGGDARFFDLRDLAVSPGGKLYVADRHRVAAIEPAGEVKTVAGAPLGWFYGRFRREFETRALAVSPEGDVYAVPSIIVDYEVSPGPLVALTPGDVVSEPVPPEALASMLESVRYWQPAEPNPTRRNKVLGQMHKPQTRWEDALGGLFTSFQFDEVGRFLRIEVDGEWLQLEGPDMAVQVAAVADEAATWFEGGRLTATRYDILQQKIVAIRLSVSLEEQDAATARFEFEEGNHVTVRSLTSFEPFVLADPDDEPAPLGACYQVCSWERLLGRTLTDVASDAAGLKLGGPGWEAIVQVPGSNELPRLAYSCGRAVDPVGLHGKQITGVVADLTMADERPVARVELRFEGNERVVLASPATGDGVQLLDPKAMSWPRRGEAR